MQLFLGPEPSTRSPGTLPNHQPELNLDHTKVVDRTTLPKAQCAEGFCLLQM